MFIDKICLILLVILVFRVLGSCFVKFWRFSVFFLFCFDSNVGGKLRVVVLNGWVKGLVDFIVGVLGYCGWEDSVVWLVC